MMNSNVKKILFVSLLIIFIVCSLFYSLKNGERVTEENNKDYIINYSELIEDLDNADIKEINLAEIKESTYTLNTNGTYKLIGTYNGQIIINADVSLILDNAKIFNEEDSAIIVNKGNDLLIYSLEKSENTIISGKEVEITYLEDLDESRGAIYSKGDIYISGKGKLIVEGYINNAIQSSDYIIIEDANIEVKSINHAIKSNEGILIENSSLNLLSGSDAIKTDSAKAEGNIGITNSIIEISSCGDGLSSGKDIYINSGSFSIITNNGHKEDLNIGSMDNLNFENFFNIPTQRVDRNFFNRGEEKFNDQFRPDGPNNNNDFNKFFNQEENNRMDLDELNKSNSSNYSSKGIRAKNLIYIKDGEFNIDSLDDAINSSNELIIEGGKFTLYSSDDAITSETSLVINGGEINILYSYEGIESTNLTINSGNININSEDDGLNAGQNDSTLTINGGDIYVNAKGDGLDSNGDLIINGGFVVVDGPTDSRNGALDSGSENGGVLLSNGGEVLAIGASGMDDVFASNSTNPFFRVRIEGNKGSQLTIKDSEGNILLTHTSAKSFSSIVYASEKLESNKTYLIEVDGRLMSITLDGNNYVENGGPNSIGKPNRFK